jgi:hypothetical protein
MTWPIWNVPFGAGAGTLDEPSCAEEILVVADLYHV